MLDSSLQIVPLWVFGLVLVLGCILASEGGRFLSRKLAARGMDSQTRPDAQAYIVGAIFGLLAFMIGITFSIAISRFDDRRDWIAQEANAINTTYLRASLFDEPFRSQLQSTIRDYAHSRIAPDGLWDDRVDLRLKQSQQLQKRLWNETRAAVYPVRETELASYFLESMNETLVIGNRRELAGRSHIPGRIIDALLLYLLIASAVLGFQLGGEPVQLRPTSTLLFVLFAITIGMILDLDRPRAGAIQVPQLALQTLVSNLDQAQARNRPVPAGADLRR